MAKLEIGREVLRKHLQPPQSHRRREILRHVVAHPVPYVCQVHTHWPVPHGKDPRTGHSHATKHNRAHRLEVVSPLLQHVRTAQVTVGDQRQSSQRGCPGEELVAGSALKSLFEEPRMQNNRIYSGLLQPPHPRHKTWLPLWALMT